MGEADGPELAAAQAVEHPAEERAGPVLGADLDHAAVLAGRRHHLLPFPQVVRERLLDVDVLARLAGPDRRQGVPVVRQGDDHRVDALVVEHLANIGVGGDRFAAFLERFDAVGEHGLVGVAQGHDPGFRDLSQCPDELSAPASHASGNIDAAQTHNSDPDRVALRTPGQRWQTSNQTCGEGRLEERPACDGFHAHWSPK